MNTCVRGRVCQALGLWTIVLLTLGLTSCSGPTSHSVRLEGKGATFPAALYQSWFDAFNKQHDGVQVSYRAVGSSAGVEAFLQGDGDARIDFAASDNGLTPLEAEKVRRGVLQIPTAAGLIALVYNLPGVPDLKLSRAAYAGIFLGSITRWNDVAIADTNPGCRLPDREIRLVVRQDGSGTTFLLTNHLAAISSEWRTRHGAEGKRKTAWPAHAMQENGNEAVGAKVKAMDGAIGYVDLGTLQAGGLHAAQLQNKRGQFVQADREHADCALQNLHGVVDKPTFLPDPEGSRDYPIVGLTYLLLYRHYDDPAKTAALKELVLWCLGAEGQSMCAGQGYLRLPTALANEGIAAVRRIGN